MCRFRWCEDALWRTVPLRIFISEWVQSHGAPACGMHHTACQRKSHSFLWSVSRAHARMREAEQTAMGLIQHWLTSAIQHRLILAFFWGFFLPLEQIFSRHLAEWVTCPSYTGASSALWGVFWSLPTFYEPMPTHTYTHTFPSWKDQRRWLPECTVFWMQVNTIVLQFPPGFLTSLQDFLQPASNRKTMLVDNIHYCSHI